MANGLLICGVRFGHAVLLLFCLVGLGFDASKKAPLVLSGAFLNHFISWPPL
jgi:hypothetical protein